MFLLTSVLTWQSSSIIAKYIPETSKLVVMLEIQNQYDTYKIKQYQYFLNILNAYL